MRTLACPGFLLSGSSLPPAQCEPGATRECAIQQDRRSSLALFLLPELVLILDTHGDFQRLVEIHVRRAEVHHDFSVRCRPSRCFGLVGESEAEEAICHVGQGSIPLLSEALEFPQDVVLYRERSPHECIITSDLVTSGHHLSSNLRGTDRRPGASEKPNAARWFAWPPRDLAAALNQPQTPHMSIAVFPATSRRPHILSDRNGSRTVRTRSSCSFLEALDP